MKIVNFDTPLVQAMIRLFLLLLLLLPAASCRKELPPPEPAGGSSAGSAASSPSTAAVAEAYSHPGSGMQTDIDRYKERLKTDPADLEALIFLGNANFEIGRFDQAGELYLRALAIDPKNPEVRTDLATCYRKAGLFDQAVTELRTTLMINPDHPPALYNLGVILLFDKGDRKGALTAWEKLEKTHPKHSLSTGLAEKIKQVRRGEKPVI